MERERLFGQCLVSEPYDWTLFTTDTRRNCCFQVYALVNSPLQLKHPGYPLHAGQKTRSVGETDKGAAPQKMLYKWQWSFCDWSWSTVSTVRSDQFRQQRILSSNTNIFWETALQRLRAFKSRCPTLLQDWSGRKWDLFATIRTLDKPIESERERNTMA